MLNIALCDDMPVFRDVLEMHINEYASEHNIQFITTHFNSGEALLEMFDSDKSFFNLFFLDYYMKTLTGLDTALHIRQFDQKASIVFVSSNCRTNDLTIANPIKILMKPVQKEEVFEILNLVLSE